MYPSISWLLQVNSHNRRTKTSCVVVVCLSAFLFGLSQVAIADSGTNAIDASETMREARKLIDGQKYKGALRKLRKIVALEPFNADAWSLIGFSERKQARLVKAEKAYKKALKLDPDHQGALSYQGELFLQQNRRELAEANREKLAQLCPQGCKALEALDAALDGNSTNKSLDY